MRPVKPLVADSGSGAEMQMWLGKGTSPVRAPVEGDDLALVRVIKGVKIRCRFGFPRALRSVYSNEAIVMHELDVNSGFAREPDTISGTQCNDVRLR